MKYLFTLVAALVMSTAIAQKGLDYFLPEGAAYDPAIPTPEDVIGHRTGEFHVTYDKIIRYMEVLAETSSRVSLEIIGYSWEKQPMMLVSFTSPGNKANLDRLRLDHLDAIDPASSAGRVRDEPLVIWLGYTVHGNEPSGVNAAPVVAYYLAACQDESLLEILNNTIILMEPCQNPDGANRFASWVNSHRSMNNVSDPNSIEFSEAWPGSRSNHYWFDLNRDWMFLQHPESRARIAAFHKWKPNVLTDHHEMGGSSTFFFQPGVPSRSNPIVPESNFSLTQKLGTFHAAALDEIGSLYFSEEVFDDYYFGKGSAYPDVNGGIGILFEQASTRGHLAETAYGKIPFEFGIRNQVKTSLSTIEGSWSIRRELQYDQKDFFKSALEEAASARVKGYVFGCPEDRQRASMMIDILMQHQVEVYLLKDAFTKGDVNLPEGFAYYIPSEQAQYRMIRALMEKVTGYADSTFYDISAWTLPLAMGVQYAEVDSRELGSLKTGKALTDTPFIEGVIYGDIPKAGYLFSIEPYLAPKAIYELQDQGVLLKIGTEPFSLSDGQNTVDFPYGTVFVPVQAQKIQGQELHSLMNRTARLNGLEIFSVNTGYTPEGPDLGSGSFGFLKKPEILMLTGGGVSSREAGQVWWLLDTRYGIPVTLADAGRFGSIDLSRYNTLILAGGSYRELGESGQRKLQEWIRAGGRVVALRSANSFLRSAGIISYEQVKREKPEGTKEPEGRIRPYSERRRDRLGQSIPGSIFQASLDLSHPLGFGYKNPDISVFKTGTEFIAPSANPYANPLYFTDDPLESGFINDENLELLRGSISVMTHSYGRGTVISFFDDPVFRGVFAGLHKMFMNAVFLGGIL